MESDNNLIERAEKIKKEKRKRTQAYAALDYLTSMTTYFDFFSADTFDIAVMSKKLSQISEKKNITSEYLLLSFFYLNIELKNVLEEFGITEEVLKEYIFPIKDRKKENFLFLQFPNFKTWINDIKFYFGNDKKKFNYKLPYSYEVNLLFEKCADNALTRFKTPVITAEILLITLLESKNTKVSKIFKRCLQNETNWYVFRYRLMKRLHSEESAIREDVIKNQQYFAYLLKTQLHDNEFKALMNTNLQAGVTLFRNTLIVNILKVDLYEKMYIDIRKSIKLKKQRKYSS
jgi:hypothetical protein